MVRIHHHRYLVRPECTLDLQPVDELRSRPTLGRPQYDHRPSRARGVFLVASVRLDPPDAFDGRSHRRGHELMHGVRVIPLDEQRRPTAPAQELVQLVFLDASEHGRIADLVAIQVQDRQHGAVGSRVQELVGLPGGGQGTGFRFAVSDHAGNDELRVVERGPEGVAQRVPEFAALVNRPGSRRSHMARNAAGKGELLEEFLEPRFVLGHVRVDLAPRSFEVHVAHDRRTTVAGAGHIEHIQIVFLDDPVQMHVDEILTRRRSPVADHQRLHVGQL